MWLLKRKEWEGVVVVVVVVVGKVSERGYIGVGLEEEEEEEEEWKDALEQGSLGEEERECKDEG